MDEFSIQVTDHPNETDWQWLEDTINRFNVELTGYDDYRPLAIFLRDNAEEEALARGCKQATVETHSFQAPQFYPARGYIACGVTEDYPVGFQHISFQKTLIERQSIKEF